MRPFNVLLYSKKSKGKKVTLQSVFRSISSAHASGGYGKPDIRFLPDGTLLNAELNIMNLRRGMQGSSSQLQWEKVMVYRVSKK